MAQQVQYLIKIFISIIVFISCSTKKENAVIMRLVSESDTNLNLNSGIVYYQKNLFSGSVFSLNEPTKDTAAIRNYLHGREDGIWKEYYPNKQLKSIRYFKNGKKIDVSNGYWENGERMYSYFFNDDEYDGVGREWNRKGLLIKEMNYVKGHEEGPQKMFYDNGKVRSNYIIKNGKRYGLLGTKNCINVSDSIFKK